MATDILTLARETLALADKATPGELHTGTQAWPGSKGTISCNGVYRSVDGGSDLVLLCNYDGADADFFAHARTAAPELARFVEMVDAVLRMEQHLVEFPGGDLSRGYRLAIDHMRRRLGLDTTEPAAALKAKEERKP